MSHASRPRPHRLRAPVRLVAALAVVPVLLVAGLLAAGPALAGGGCHAESLTDRAGTTVDMVDLCFSPAVLRVKPGQVVTFVNRDEGMTHPVSGANNAWNLGTGDGGSLRFDEAGVYPYFCHVHLGMIGVIVVGDGNSAAPAGAGPVNASDPAAVAPAAATAPAPAAATAGARGISGAALVRVALVVVAAGLAGLAVGRRRRGAAR
jgi:plastocyanin